jgi:TonB family protein
MRAIRRFAALAAMAGICLLPVLGRAQTSADASAMERLRSQMTTALAAARQGDQAKLKEIGRGWIIPDHELWFKAMFEEEQGAKLGAAYRANLEPTEKYLPKLFEWLAQQEGEIVVEDAKTLPKRSDTWCGQTLESLLKGDLALYRVSIGKADSSGLQSGRVAGYFALVNGDYRRLDCQALGLGQPPSSGPQSATPSGPIRIGANVQKARILRRVTPVYPEEARLSHISGTVRFHAIIGKDGKIKHLEFVSGHPALKVAAFDAVRQWLYQPTLINGEPIEVDTTIDVNFQLNW